MANALLLGTWSQRPLPIIWSICQQPRSSWLVSLGLSQQNMLETERIPHVSKHQCFLQFPGIHKAPFEGILYLILAYYPWVWCGIVFNSRVLNTNPSHCCSQLDIFKSIIKKSGEMIWIKATTWRRSQEEYPGLHAHQSPILPPLVICSNSCWWSQSIIKEDRDGRSNL